MCLLTFDLINHTDRWSNQVRFKASNTDYIITSFHQVEKPHCLLFETWFVLSTDSFKHADSFRNEPRKVLMNESLNHSLKRFVQTRRFNKKLSIQISESLTHSLIQFVQTRGSIQKRTTRSLNKRVTESFTHTICSNTRIYSETNHAES